MRALFFTLRLKRGGLLHGGPPCSSFCWVSRWSTKRSNTNPLGCKTIPGTVIANAKLGGMTFGADALKIYLRFQMLLEVKCICKFELDRFVFHVVLQVLRTNLKLLRIVARVAMLVLVATSRGCHVMLEQPRGSVMPKFPLFVRIATKLRKFYGISWKHCNLPCPQRKLRLFGCVAHQVGWRPGGILCRSLLLSSGLHLWLSRS